MTAGRRDSRGCFGRRPAQTASWIIAWVRGLAVMRAPRCAGAPMSRGLLYPIPDWPASSVACVTLSSVRPGKSRSCIPLRGLLAIAVVLKDRQHQPMGGWLPPAARLRVVAFLPPPCPEPGCTPEGHRRLLVLHHDPSALTGALLVQHETGFDVPTLLLPCLWREAATPPRALPASRPSQSSFSRRL